MIHRRRRPRSRALPGQKIGSVMMVRDGDAAVTGDRFLVEGGHPLRGTVAPAGNKNEALPVLAACLLVRGEVVVDNVPRIRDVTALLEGLRHLRGRVAVDEAGSLRPDRSRLGTHDPAPPALSQLPGPGPV